MAGRNLIDPPEGRARRGDHLYRQDVVGVRSIAQLTGYVEPKTIHGAIGRHGARVRIPRGTRR